jgi:hypothetical protein
MMMPDGLLLQRRQRDEHVVADRVGKRDHFGLLFG